MSMKLWGFPIQDYAVILQAVSIFVTAVFAIFGLNAWRKQLIGKRRIEVAEEALLATYKARDAMAFVRSPGVMRGEGATRPPQQGETPELAEARDRAFVPLERLQKVYGDFAQLATARLVFEVHFGRGVVQPFDEILQARNRVWIAANTLFGDDVGQGDFVREQRRIVLQRYGRAGETDEIAEALSSAVRRIEDLCRPHLGAGRGNAWGQSLRKGLSCKRKATPSQG